MAAALLPLTVSATVGYFLLNSGVIDPIHDVAYRQREQIDPVQQLRVLVWDTVVPVDEYLEDSNPVHPEAYRKLRLRIEADFAGLVENLAGDQAAIALVQRAGETWSEADRFATDLISISVQLRTEESVAKLQRFHGAVIATSDRLAAAYETIADGIREDHDIAVRNYERSMWIAGIAGGISMLALFGGVFLIGRIMEASVDRLVEGAVRFAEGDRNHRIEVQIPPELHRVASEFNYMIDRIFETEKTLDELAHVDSLTGLPNRRAFERTLTEVSSRFRRHGESSCLLAIDIDHFKRVNDTYGHAAGDEVLREASRVMEHATRPFDKVFRTGGEEFFVVMPKTGQEEALQAADRIREAAEAAHIRIDGQEIRFTISIGVADISAHKEPQNAIVAADAALYRAKESGRNKVIVDSADHTGIRGIT